MEFPSHAAQVDSTKHTLAKYLLELSILDYQLMHVHPSEVSAACLCLSIRLLDCELEEDELCWGDTLQHYSTFSEKQLQPIMNRLALLVSKSSTSKQQVSDLLPSLLSSTVQSLPLAIQCSAYLASTYRPTAQMLAFVLSEILFGRV